MKTSNRFKTSLAAIALVAIGAPQVAYAADANTSTVNKVHVKVNDLNLTSAAGIEVLYQRLSSASREVCGNYSDLKSVGSLKQLRINKECFESTLADAMADVNFSTLAQTTGFSIPTEG